MQATQPPPLSNGRIPTFSQPNQNVINEVGLGYKESRLD